MVGPCGLSLAVGCRRRWGLRYRHEVWLAEIGLGAVTMVSSLVAGLMGPVAIAICAFMLSLPEWGAGWRRVRRA